MSLKPANRSRKALAPRTASPVTIPTYSLTGLPSMAVVVLTIILILLQFVAVGCSYPYLPQRPSVHSCNLRRSPQPVPRTHTGPRECFNTLGPSRHFGE